MREIQKMPSLRLEMVHLQLTRRCNLNCWFCGQRKTSWDSAKACKELTVDEWLGVIDQLDEYARESGCRPSVMIWGGEAALSPAFVPVVRRLAASGYRLGMVTNGTLLERDAELIRSSFEKLYLSIDGDEELHDEIRGRGVYRKAAENLRLLKENGPKRVIMTVLTPAVAERLPEILEAFSALEPDEVILQERIFLEPGEVRQYREWMKSSFQAEAANIGAWLGTEEDTRERSRLRESCQAKLHGLSLPYTLTYLPHLPARAQPFCRSPFRHLHITWNGQTSFCTDFTDFSCGSVRETPVARLFTNARADAFRREVLKGRCVTCGHCSWRYKESFLEL